MNNLQKVSVVIPAYNREWAIEKAVRSVLAQSYSNLEIVVVDDGSVDDTIATVRRLSEADVRVRLVQHERNRGAQAARNTGAKSATGPWLAFLDSDDTWLPESLNLRMKLAISGNYKVVHSEGYLLRGDSPRRQMGTAPLSGSIYPRLLMNPCPLYQTMLIRADAFREIDGCDETIIAYQEWDTAIRLAKTNCFGFVPEPTFVYDCRGSDTISADLARAARGYWQIVRKHSREIVRTLGFAAMSHHHTQLAQMYRSAGELKSAHNHRLKSFLWRPSPVRIIRKLRAARSQV